MKDDPQDNDDGSLPLLPHDFLIRVKNVNPLRDIILPCSLFLCLKKEPIGHFFSVEFIPISIITFKKKKSKSPANKLG